MQINSPVLLELREGRGIGHLSAANREAFSVTIRASALLVERVARGAEVSVRARNQLAGLPCLLK